MLCSPVMPIMLLKLTYSSQIMLKIFLVHRQNISFSIVLPTIHHWMYHETSGPMRAHALNGGPHIIITFSRGEGLGQAYYSHWSKDFSSIIPIHVCFSMPTCIIPKIMLV